MLASINIVENVNDDIDVRDAEKDESDESTSGHTSVPWVVIGAVFRPRFHRGRSSENTCLVLSHN